MKNPLEIVATGLGFLLAAAAVPVLLGVPTVALLAASVFSAPADPPSGAEPVFALAAVFVTGLSVSALLGAIGSFLCLAVPPESRCSEAAVTMLLLHALGLFTVAARSLATLGGGADVGPGVLDVLGAGLWLLEQIVFLVFLYRLGVYLDRADVRRGVWAVPAMVLVTAALFGVLALLVQRARGGPDREAGLLALHLLPLPPPFRDKPLLLLALLFLAAAAFTYWNYLLLLWRARGACNEAEA